MSVYWHFALALFAGVAILWLPGLIALGLSGLRRRAIYLLAVAPLISVGLTGLTGVLLAALKLGWDLESVPTAVLLGAVVLGLALRWLRAPRWQTAAAQKHPLTGMPALLGSLIGGAVLIVSFLISLPRLDAFEQTFDTAFHLNAVRYILDTSNGSALWVSSMTGTPGSFYPVAWHDLVSVITMLTGATVTLAANALNVIVFGVIWPLGMAFLAQALWRKAKWAGFAAGLLAAGIPAYPFLFFYFGSLYPNLLGVALLPAALTLGLRALHFIPQIDVESDKSSWLLLAAGAVALGLAHPNALMALIAGLVVAMTAGEIKRIRFGWTTWAGLRRVWSVLVLGVPWGVLLVMWRLIRPDPTAPHLESNSISSHAVGEVVTNAQGGGVVAAAVSLLMLVGAVLLIRRGQLFGVLLWLVTASSFVIVAASPSPRLRLLVGGVFYQDANRIAALLAIPAILLAAYGLNEILSRFCGQSWSWLWRAVIVLGLIPALVWPQLQGLEHLRASFDVFSESVMVRTDEQEVIDSLKSEVQPQDRVMIIPVSGGVFSYSLEDRRVTPEHFFDKETPQEEYIREHIDEPESSELCNALHNSDVRYLLDFGRVTVGIPSGPELDDGGQLNTRVVVQHGDARLLKITACGLDDEHQR